MKSARFPRRLQDSPRGACRGGIACRGELTVASQRRRRPGKGARGGTGLGPRPSAGGKPGAKDALGFYGYRIRDVMNRKVVTVRPDAPLEVAASLMSQHGISGLPVVDGRGKLSGVLSQKDVVRLLHQEAGLSLPGGVFDLVLDSSKSRRSDLPATCRAVLQNVPVRRVMSRRAITVPAGASLEEAIQLLIENEINRLPVLEAGRLVGIVTRHDLLAGAAGATGAKA
jgi:CBS domain-containing protein